jgi:hypothetical protein
MFDFDHDSVRRCHAADSIISKSHVNKTEKFNIANCAKGVIHTELHFWGYLSYRLLALIDSYLNQSGLSYLQFHMISFSLD